MADPTTSAWEPVDEQAKGWEPVNERPNFALNPPRVQGPALRMTQQDLLGQLPGGFTTRIGQKGAASNVPVPPGFMADVGERIKQNIMAVPNTLDTALAMSKQAAGGQLTPEEQALVQANDAGRQGMQQMIYGDAATAPLAKTPGGQMLEKGIAATVMGPRMLYEQAKDYYQHPANLVGDVTLALPEVMELRPPANKEFRRGGTAPPTPPESLLTPEQQARYTAKLDKANADMARQQAAVAKAQAQDQMARQIQQNVQETHEVVRGSLNQRWEDLRTKVADAPVDTAPVITKLDESRRMLAGVPEDLKIFKDITQNLEQRNAEAIGEAAAAKGTPEAYADYIAGERNQPAATVPFGDARTQYTALGEAWSRASGNLRRALRNVWEAYGQQLQVTADAAGAGPDYSQLRKDWSQYMEDWQDQRGLATGGSPLAKALQAADPGFVQSLATGKAGERMQQTLAKYAQHGAQPDVVGQLRQSTVKVPTLKEVQRPYTPPVAAKPGPLLRHGGRIGGKLVGGTLGSAVGHPLLGYSVGGEIGTEIANKIAQRKAGARPGPYRPPMPPAAPVEAAPPPPPAGPPESGPPGGVERRGDTAARAKFAAMTPEQQYQTAFTNPVTGMPNARAFSAAGPAPSYGMSDVAGLKWLNDHYGQAAGDALLQAKARALQEAGLEAYHTGGDEFKMRGNDPADLNNRLVKANEILRNSVIRVTDPKTGLVHYFEGAEFRHGVGPTSSAAEQGMLGRKAAQKATRGTQGTLREVPPPPGVMAND